MRRQTRRQGLRGVAAISAGGVLSALGCAAPGSGGGGGQGGPSATACRGTVEIWTGGIGGIGGPAMDKLVADFAARNTACTVKTNDAADDMRTKVTTAVAAGAPPTLFGTSPGSFRSYTDAGLITDVDDSFRRDRLNKDDFSTAFWIAMSYGGKVRGMPLRANPDFVLHWLKPHFQEAGLDPNKGPQTIAELDRMLPMLHRDRNGELERIAMQPWDLYGTGANTVNAWTRAFGGSFYDEAKDELTFNHPRILRAVEWYLEWARRLDAQRILGVATAFNATSEAPFVVTRKWSIHPLTPSWWNRIKAADPTLATPEMIGAGPFPYEAPGPPGQVTAGGWGVMMVAGATERQGGWEFMKYVGASDEGTTTVSRLTGIPGWLKSPGLAELSKDPIQKAYVDGVKRAQFAQFGFYVPVSVSFAPIDEAIAGKRSVRDALDAIHRQATTLYAEYKTRFKTKGG
jgi:ABC-type glycerol-3-phosphate transport system substrate-binding protein